MNHEQEIYVCPGCGERMTADECAVDNNDLRCKNCGSIVSAWCDCCSRQYPLRSDHGDECTNLCPECFINSYFICDGCGVLVRNENGYTLPRHDLNRYCYDCYCDRREDDDDIIHGYFYKPDPIFFGDGERFFGVELEIDNAGYDECHAEHLLDIANTGESRLYIKSDSSLDDGMELVTHPMTLDYHQHEMPWQHILDKCIDMGYYSHKTDTCGLHIHVNRTSLGKSVDAQEAVIGRILYIFEHFWDKMLAFSRRTERQLDRWAARYNYKGHPKEVLDHVKHLNPGRYTCVNLLNYSTIEFRIFRGTLKYNTLIATLQMVNRICDLAYFLSDTEIRNLSWPEFVASVKEPELIQYLKERRLYVSEPVETEEEI